MKPEDIPATKQSGTVATALAILSLFSARSRQWSIRDLATRMDMPYSTAHRYVRSLEAGGFLTRDERTGLYRVGLPVIELAGVSLSELDVWVHGNAYLDNLATVTGFSANLSVLYHADILHIGFSLRGSRNPRFHGIIGRRTPAHCTAMGKAMLAAMPWSDVHALITRQGWEPRTPHSICDFQTLRQELERITSRGYATEMDESTMGNRCVAAAIRGKLGEAAGAISVSGDRASMDDARINEIAPVVMRHADMISHHLGYVALG